MQRSHCFRMIVIMLASLWILLGFDKVSVPSTIHAAVSVSQSVYSTQGYTELGQGIDHAELVSHIDHWKNDLSKNDPFKEWQHASYSIYPLGPGTHGWLVLLSKQEKEIGYMIISASEDHELTLAEYGVGPNPLFSINTLYPSLVQHELISSSMKPEQLFQQSDITIERYYLHPMLALWRVEPAGKPASYIHAKTGEVLLITDAKWKAQEQVIAHASHHNKPMTTTAAPSVQTIPPFDPFEKMYWLTHDPLTFQQTSQLTKQIDRKAKITYVSNWFKDSYMVPVSISGYQHWGDDTYLMMEEEGTRWIPYQSLQRFGNFYK